jgi:ribosomal protein S12 methylthiotransferase accessory factor
MDGPVVPLAGLPSIAGDDIAGELDQLARALAARGYPLFTVDTTHPEWAWRQLQFRARLRLSGTHALASLGLFTGRILAEQADPATADKGLASLPSSTPARPLCRFSRDCSPCAWTIPKRPCPNSPVPRPCNPWTRTGPWPPSTRPNALSLLGDWEAVEPHLDRAIAACPEVKEYCNLRGVARFQGRRYREAADDFQAALALDAGSGMDLANLGLCHLRLDHPEQAAHYLGAALELDASLDFARTHLARLLGAGIEPNNTATGSHT